MYSCTVQNVEMYSRSSEERANTAIQQLIFVTLNESSTSPIKLVRHLVREEQQI